MKNLFSLSVALLFASFTFAQVPQGISYQAIAFNPGGNPVISSNVGVRISILDNSTSGPVVYSETHTKTTNAQGLFNLNIGQGTPTSGSFSTISWQTNSKFLKVELDPAGGTNYTSTGTNQLMSVPYALTAATVESISASDIAGSVESDTGAIGVMTTSTAYAYNGTTWHSQSLSGTPKEIIGTNGKVGVLTTSSAYAYNGSTWHSQSLSGTGQKIIGSNGRIGVMTTSSAYAYNGNTWHSQSLSGTAVEIVSSKGFIGVMTSSSAYAYNGSSWNSQSLSGTPQKIIAKRGKIMVYTSSSAYAFDGNSWDSQSLSGTPLDYAH